MAKKIEVKIDLKVKNVALSGVLNVFIINY